jgi:glycosyltransferase involved in cell wall biosynthesis
VFFGFSSASLEALIFARELGKLAVIDQIDAARVEDQIVAEETERFPGLECDTARIPEAYFHRLEREWETSDRVVVNSSWSRSALIRQGVPEAKVFTVPLPFRSLIKAEPRDYHLPLKVLWLGTLCLRKGIHYALQAASLLRNAPVHFTFAGDSRLDPAKIVLPPNVTIIDRVPRIKTPDLYRSHDIFILPTLSDGFAITLVEAMAYGLPVISTDRCGEVVQNGSSGILIPAFHSSALAEAILHFLDDRSALPRMSMEAYRRSKDFHPSAIWPQYEAVYSGTV